MSCGKHMHFAFKISHYWLVYRIWLIQLPEASRLHVKCSVRENFTEKNCARICTLKTSMLIEDEDSILKYLRRVSHPEIKGSGTLSIKKCIWINILGMWNRWSKWIEMNSKGLHTEKRTFRAQVLFKKFIVLCFFFGMESVPDSSEPFLYHCRVPLL